MFAPTVVVDSVAYRRSAGAMLEVLPVGNTGTGWRGVGLGYVFDLLVYLVWLQYGRGSDGDERKASRKVDRRHRRHAPTYAPGVRARTHLPVTPSGWIYVKGMAVLRAILLS